MTQWIAAALSLAGILLNARKNIWCWPVWILSNLAWITYGVWFSQWAVLVTFTGFLFGNIYGWMMWHGDHDYVADDFPKLPPILRI